MNPLSLVAPARAVMLTKGESVYAEELWLVVELNIVEGKHGYMLVEGNPSTQYYDFRGAHKNTHYQILPQVQLTQLKAKWLNENYQEWDGVGDIPDLFYIYLDNRKDHHLPYITVINNVLDVEELHRIQSRIPFQELAKLLIQEMFTNNRKRKQNYRTSDSRQNVRGDIGFSGLNSTDGSSIPGMNIPGHIVEPSRMEGCPGDDDREISIYKAACAVGECADWIQANVNVHDTMAGDLFMDNDRAELFSRRWFGRMRGRDAQLETSDRFARFEGSSVFVVGELPGGELKKTEKHVDGGNGTREGFDHTPTLTKIVDVEVDGVVWRVRVGCNIYSKRACGAALERRNKMLKLIDFLVESENRFENDVRLPHPAMRFSQPNNLPDDIWAYRAGSDKSLYYSLFGNELRRIAQRTSWNRAVMLEALFTIHLTPCPKSWLVAMRETMDILEKSRQNADGGYKNLAEVFISVRLRSAHSVGCGEYNRCRASAESLVQDELYSSIRNLDSILESLSCDPQGLSTEDLVRRMQSPESVGGCSGIGAFHAYATIHIATMCGLVSQREHVNNISISKTTRTAKRLTERFGIERENIKDVVPFVSLQLGRPRYVVENLICECLRRDNRVNGIPRPVIKYDVFSLGDKWMRVESTGVYEYDISSRRNIIQYGTYSANDWYNPHVRWWEGDTGESAILVAIRRRERDAWWRVNTKGQ